MERATRMLGARVAELDSCDFVTFTLAGIGVALSLYVELVV